MTTEAQLAANRANAKHSTGPKTTEGKARVSRNALRHGLRARLIVDNPTTRGDRSRFRALLDDLIAELSPVGVLEEFAAETIACCVWRLKYVVHEELHSAEIENEESNPYARVERLERELAIKAGELLEPEPPKPLLAGNERIGLLIRYEAHLYRQYYRARRELQSLQATRLAQATLDGSSSAPPPTPTYPCSSSSPAEPFPAAPVAPPVSVALTHRAGVFPFAETWKCQTKPIMRANANNPLDDSNPSQRVASQRVASQRVAASFSLRVPACASPLPIKANRCHRLM